MCFLLLCYCFFFGLIDMMCFQATACLFRVFKPIIITIKKLSTSKRNCNTASMKSKCFSYRPSIRFGSILDPIRSCPSSVRSGSNPTPNPVHAHLCRIKVACLFGKVGLVVESKISRSATPLISGIYGSSMFLTSG